MKKWLMIGGGAAALIGVSVGLSLFLTGGMSKQAEATAQVAPPPQENPFKKAQYIKMEPFIVTLANKSRPNMLQIDVSASTTDAEAVEAFKQHTPVIRNNLLMLMNAQDVKRLQTNEGKEALRQEALTAVQEIMKERYGSEGIDEIFFTKFVMQ
jgi:flagellar FliL protein